VTATSSALSPQLIAAIEAGACILTPNQRSAHWLKLLHANHAIAQGHSAWATPCIQSFNTFVSQAWRARGDRTERVLSTEQTQLVWQRIVGDSPWAERLLSPQAIGNTSFRSWERLQAWQISRDQLAFHAAATDSDEARALLEWSDGFAELCRRRAWLPVQLLPQRLLHLPAADIANAFSYLVTVTDDLLPSHRALLTHVAQHGARWEQLTPHETPGHTDVYECTTPDGELHAAAIWAQEQLSNGITSIGVAIPNLDERAAHVRRIFADVFAQSTRTFVADTAHSDRAQQEARFAIASYHALADFPAVRVALDVLQMAAGRASSALAGGLLRAPFLAASQQEASLRALADRQLRTRAREHYDLVVLERAVIQCPVFAQCLRDAQSVRIGAAARALPSAMAEQFMALWRAFGWPGAAVDSDEQQVVARLQLALGEFGALDELLGPLSFGVAVREFEQFVRNTSFEPRSRPAPITIIDINASDGLRFDALWAAGITESTWPPPASPDVFIPIELQRQAGMPNATAHTAREHARRRFERLQSAARSVALSWARTDQDIDVLPSPWLQAFGAARCASADHSTYATRMYDAKPVLETIEELRAPLLHEARARGGARIFELQSQCPFRAFAELRLHAQPLDAVAPSVDARDRGTLIHAALADVWQTLLGSDGLAQQSSEQLETLVRTSLARHAAKLLDGASAHRIRMLQIEQDIAAERILALLQLDRQRAPFRVAGRPETQEQISVGALRFELRLDRTDELLSNAQRIIIDYKTGNTVRSQSWTSERPEQPQLPLYAATHPHNLAAVSFVTLGAKGIGYQGAARDADVLPGVKAFNTALPSPHQGWQGLLAHWESVITRLANAFAEGQAAVDPLPNACRYCHLSSVCRVNEQAEAGLTALHDEGGA
jgi:ATP-dependent helicase/nuclease subunit B